MYAGQIVVEGNVHTLFKEPKPPYTIGLLNSMPQFSGEVKRLEAISGQVPHPSEYLPGCRFAQRCPSRMDLCENIEPTVYDFGH
ncbi:putative D,D-dipeptide transport ATP-binding protein DdpD [compost metagenome]